MSIAQSESKKLWWKNMSPDKKADLLKKYSENNGCKPY